MVKRSCWSLVMMLALDAGRAHAAAPDPRALAARQACAAGRVEQGIELLAEIVAATGDSDAVYNQARCYEQNGRPQEALARFREYLRTSKVLTAEDGALEDKLARTHWTRISQPWYYLVSWNGKDFVVAKNRMNVSEEMGGNHTYAQPAT